MPHTFVQLSAAILIFLVALTCSLSSMPLRAAPHDAQKLYAISSVNFGDPPGTPANTINFFDITKLNSSSTGVFDNSPLFSVWIGLDQMEGYELSGKPIGSGGNFSSAEDISAFTFNPANGTIYAVAFDQLSDDIGGGIPSYGDARATGDTAGDFDLYKIDLQAILDDYNNNGRERGTIYAPEFMPSTVALEQAFFDSGDLRFDGIVDGLWGNVPHPDSVDFPTEIPTVHVDAITKIGELGRAPTEDSRSFFDYQIEFVDPQTLVTLDGSSDNSPIGDHQIRVFKRVNTSPGAASVTSGYTPADPESNQGGYNGGTTESWESTIIGRPQMDEENGSRSDVIDWAFVQRDGIIGVWIAEADPGQGDQVSFFEIDLSGPTPTATKKELYSSTGTPFMSAFHMDENPNVDTATEDGEIDNLFVDKDGNLVLIESGFFDTDEFGTGQTGYNGYPAEEPRIIALGIENYDSPDSDASGGNEVVPTGFTSSGTGINDTAPWTVSASIPTGGPEDDDPEVWDSRRAVLDRGTGRVYIIDADSSPGNTEDIYVFDPVSGTIVYYEDDGFNPGILNIGSFGIISRGDINDDGAVDTSDIALLGQLVLDPTKGGTISADLGGEWYDLTGDSQLTTADLSELIESILGYAAGDFDFDGDVDVDDIDALSAAATGDYDPLFDLNSDGQVTFVPSQSGSLSDSDVLIREILATQYGDANLDFAVNVADTGILLSNLSSSAGWAGGDFNGDGTVNVADTGILLSNLGFSNLPQIFHVPEPKSSLLLLSVIAAFVTRLQRQLPSAKCW